MPVTPLTFSPATTQLLGDPNQVAANETDEQRKRRLAQIAAARGRMQSALGNGTGAGPNVSSPAVAALLGGGL